MLVGVAGEVEVMMMSGLLPQIFEDLDNVPPYLLLLCVA